MKKVLLVAILLFLPDDLTATGPITNITICTPEWNNYTQEDGIGLYHELWKEVFQPAGIRIEVKYIPFKRCEMTVKKDKEANCYDVYAAGYPSPGVIVPHWHLGVDLLTVVYRKDAIPKWEGQASLANTRVSWERGYDFDKHGIINVNVEKNEFSKLSNAMKMLVANRVDFILDYDAAIKKAVTELNISDEVEIVPDAIAGPKYYMIFAETERGRKLAEIWDREMERLHKSGQLQKIYKKYGDLSYDMDNASEKR